MSVKVSVVIPTYAPPRAPLKALVQSLKAQSMPKTDFEVIFVDDGSPDDTWERLQKIRERHSFVRTERIENSGWPSRPRNVGLELARGEYVLFMDHDDQLYPRALEAGYAMASRTGADVLNGKETRTDQAKWALEVYEANSDNAVGRTDLHPLIPTNPHKLFRRAMLMEHGIRFPEGGRVPWEDVFFALDVAPHAKVIAVLADTPFYHWVRGRTTSSSSFTRDRKEYWHWVREIVVQTNAKLGGRPDLAEQWRLMLLHQYRSRVLATLGPALFAAPADELEFVRACVDDLIRVHVPAELDAYLTPTQLGRATLVRAQRWDLLEQLVAVDAGLVGLGTTTSVTWRDGELEISSESRWRGGGNRPLAIRADGPRIVRDLPAEVVDALPDGAIAMEPSLEAARVSMGIRSRDSAVSWMLPSSCQSRVERVGDRPEFVVTATAVLDPATAIFGRPLDETSWDVTSRNELLGAINQRGLRTDTPARCAVQNGHVYVAYRNRTGMLSLDVDQRYRSLAGSAPLDPSRARVWSLPRPLLRRVLDRRPSAYGFEVPFRGVATLDGTEIAGTVTVGGNGPRAAAIVARADGAWLTGTVAAEPGRHPLAMTFHDRTIDTGLEVTVADGSVSLVRSG